MNQIRYIVEWNSDMKLEFLYRFRKNASGYRAKYLDADGKCVGDSNLFSILTEPHNKFYDDDAEKKAAEIAKQLGGSI
jgi:hypothetical protein